MSNIERRKKRIYLPKAKTLVYTATKQGTNDDGLVLPSSSRSWKIKVHLKKGISFKKKAREPHLGKPHRKNLGLNNE